jgi:hypothetical protein
MRYSHLEAKNLFPAGAEDRRKDNRLLRRGAVWIRFQVLRAEIVKSPETEHAV